MLPSSLQKAKAPSFQQHEFQIESGLVVSAVAGRCEAAAVKKDKKAKARTAKQTEEADAEEPEAKLAEEPEAKHAEEPRAKQAEEPRAKHAEEPEQAKHAEEPEAKQAEEPEAKQAEEPEQAKQAEEPEQAKQAEAAVEPGVKVKQEVYDTAANIPRDMSPTPTQASSADTTACGYARSWWNTDGSWGTGWSGSSEWVQAVHDDYHDYGRGWGYWYGGGRDGWGYNRSQSQWWDNDSQRSAYIRQASWGPTLLRPNTCDLFEVPATPEAKALKKNASQTGAASPRGPSPGSSDESDERDDEEEEKKKLARTKSKEQKKHHAKYMRFYRSLDSQSLK